MDFDDLSKEAQGIAKGMITRCIDRCEGMGMDEGQRKDGKDRAFLVQLKKFVDYDMEA